MALDRSALSSLASTLADVTERVGSMARSGDEEEIGVADLYEVERQLHMTYRRLEKVIREI